jgi:hypothetical protein
VAKLTLVSHGGDATRRRGKAPRAAQWATAVVKATLAPAWHDVLELPLAWDPNACLDIQVREAMR